MAKHYDLSIEYRHWPQPYQAFAHDAAVAAVCAGEQGRFDQMHDLLYLKQAEFGVESFHPFATEIGIRDLRRFDACLRSSSARSVADADVRAAREIGGAGTPTLVIDGVVHRLRADTTWQPRPLDSLLAAKRANQ